MLTSKINGSFISKRLLPFCIAFLLFLPTTSLAETHVYLLFLPLGLLFYKQKIVSFLSLANFKQWLKREKKIAAAVAIFLLLNLGMLFNLIGTNGYFSNVIRTPVLYTPILLVGAFLIARKKVLRNLLYLVAIEVIIGLVQYCIGLNTFDTSSKYFYHFINYDSLYHTRVFGISDNSSYLAQKSLIGVLLLLFIKMGFKKKQLWILFPIMVLGVVITFGRTSTIVFLLAIVIYLAQVAYRYLSHKGWSKLKYPLLRGSLIVVLSFLVFFPFWREQFTRHDLIPRATDLTEEEQGFLNSLGVGNLDMSGRREYWAGAYTFITEHKLTGNHSKRYLYEDRVHVHNSFLEFAATHGLILFGMMLLVILLGLSFKSMVILGLISLYSFGQFGIFWNISFLDIIFFSLLFFRESYSWKFYAKKENR